MIGIGQATYLQTLISQYVGACVTCSELEDSCNRSRIEYADHARTNAKRKLDNYIAKLTETGK